MTTQRSPGLFRRLAHGSLVKQILVGLVLGILLAWIDPVYLRCLPAVYRREDGARP